MLYMGICIVKSAFNDRYRDNATSLPSVYRVMLSMLSKLVKEPVQNFFLVMNHPDHLLPF